jgi:hypothetical protein
MPLGRVRCAVTYMTSPLQLQHLASFQIDVYLLSLIHLYRYIDRLHRCISIGLYRCAPI